jgi:nucleotide-binding universal stress UspA family protein
MKTIVVPTDFSPIADNAVRYGLDMARAMGTNLMLVNVYQLPISFSEVPLVTISIDEIKKISEEKLVSLKSELDRISGNAVKIYTSSRLGDVAEEIKKIKEEIHPAAIVMGTRGVSGVGRFFLGSNTMDVITRVDVPVFIIPPGVSFVPFKKIALATDLNNVVDNTPVEPIRNWVNFFNADLHVVNVDYERRHFTAYTPEESLHLDTLLSGLHPVYDFIEKKDTDEGLLEYSEKNNVDLLVLVPKKHGLLEKVLEKSTTRDLIQHTRVPLMCVHPKREKTVG